MKKTVLGIFSDRGSTEGALAELEDNGYDVRDISLVINDSLLARKIADTTGASATPFSQATLPVPTGLITALMGFGLSREEAMDFENEIRIGNILVSVPVEDIWEEGVTDILEESGAKSVRTVEAVFDDISAPSYQDEDFLNTPAREFDESFEVRSVIIGTKGGKSGRGRGWHGDSKGHAKAARGEKVKKN